MTLSASVRSKDCYKYKFNHVLPINGVTFVQYIYESKNCSTNVNFFLFIWWHISCRFHFCSIKKWSGLEHNKASKFNFPQNVQKLPHLVSLTIRNIISTFLQQKTFKKLNDATLLHFIIFSNSKCGNKLQEKSFKWSNSVISRSE